MIRRTLSALLAAALSVATLLVAPQRAQAAWTAPGAPVVQESSTTALAVAWTPVWGAPKYLVKYSTRASYSSPKYLRTYEPNAELTGLKPGTTYYVKVAVTKTTGTKLSGYGKTTAITTRRSGSSYVTLTPGGLRVSAYDADSVTLTWRARSGSHSYQVRYATNSNFSYAQYASTSGTSLTIDGLRSSTGYWFSIRTKSGDDATSTFSAAVPGSTTSGAVVAPLRVASYNIMCSNCTTSHPWSKRRAPLVAAVKAQDLDVLAVQEASQGLTKAANGTEKAHFDDLLDLLGSDYAVTNAHRYNCVKSTSPNNCVVQDRGASGGVRIFYRRSRIELLRQGSVQFEAQDPTGTKRFTAWAELRQRSSGKRFFVTNIHVDPLNDTGDSRFHYDIRTRQTRELLATIEKQNVYDAPVVLLGDFKMSKWATPSNAPYDAITKAGYVDPLGNTARSSVPARSAIVESRVHTEYNTVNNLASSPPRSEYLHGSIIDYIYVSRGMRVQQWETVVDLTSSGRFAAKPPSDHNMVRATVYLP